MSRDTNRLQRFKALVDQAREDPRRRVDVLEAVQTYLADKSLDDAFVESAVEEVEDVICEADECICAFAKVVSEWNAKLTAASSTRLAMTTRCLRRLAAHRPGCFIIRENETRECIQASLVSRSVEALSFGLDILASLLCSMHSLMLSPGHCIYLEEVAFNHGLHPRRLADISDDWVKTLISPSYIRDLCESVRLKLGRCDIEVVQLECSVYRLFLVLLHEKLRLHDNILALFEAGRVMETVQQSLSAAIESSSIDRFAIARELLTRSASDPRILDRMQTTSHPKRPDESIADDASSPTHLLLRLHNWALAAKFEHPSGKVGCQWLLAVVKELVMCLEQSVITRDVDRLMIASSIVGRGYHTLLRMQLRDQFDTNLTAVRRTLLEAEMVKAVWSCLDFLHAVVTEDIAKSASPNYGMLMHLLRSETELLHFLSLFVHNNPEFYQVTQESKFINWILPMLSGIPSRLVKAMDEECRSVCATYTCELLNVIVKYTYWKTTCPSMSSDPLMTTSGLFKFIDVLGDAGNVRFFIPSDAVPIVKRCLQALLYLKRYAECPMQTHFSVLFSATLQKLRRSVRTHAAITKGLKAMIKPRAHLVDTQILIEVGKLDALYQMCL